MFSSRPASDESLKALRRLREQRGRMPGVMLSGVDVYASLGREWELLEVMKKFADEMHEVVQNAPTAEELEGLYRITDTRPDDGSGG